GSHHRALEVDYSISDSADNRLRSHGLRAVDYGADNQRKLTRARNESGVDMGAHPDVSELAGAALRSDRDCALARADLWLVSARFRLGTARDISLGGVAPYRDPNLREDHVRHFVFRRAGATPLDGIRAARFRFPWWQPPHNRIA